MGAAILTGFEVFGRYEVNPTEILAVHLDGKTIAEHTIRSMVFPTTVLSPTQTTDYGHEIVKRAHLENASVILSLGIASEVKGVRIERECVNWVGNDKYCTPFENHRPIFTDIAPHEQMKVPMQFWDLELLRRRFSSANITLEISDDAGSYCCNALIFRVLRALENLARQIPFLFIHVPCTEEAITNIPDFDRANKRLVCQNDLSKIVEILLKSYHQQTCQ